MLFRTFVFEGRQFVVDWGVFHPVRHLSGIAFAEQLSYLLSSHASGAVTALDLGTGCGLLAATLARLELSVVATDLNNQAVACAVHNCFGLDVDVRHGDMFAPVEGESFDLAVVNPPFERAHPTRRRNSAFTSPDFLERLGARTHEFTPTLVLGFPIDEAATLEATGLELALWRTVGTAGRDLGLFVSHRTSS